MTYDEFKKQAVFEASSGTIKGLHAAIHGMLRPPLKNGLKAVPLHIPRAALPPQYARSREVTNALFSMGADPKSMSKQRINAITRILRHTFDGLNDRPNYRSLALLLGEERSLVDKLYKSQFKYQPWNTGNGYGLRPAMDKLWRTASPKVKAFFESY